jgi:hypothetical protein
VKRWAMLSLMMGLTFVTRDRRAFEVYFYELIDLLTDRDIGMKLGTA